MSNTKGEVIKQGAEARVYRTTFLGQDTIIKERFSKSYRHPVLDERLTTKRLNQESRCIARCQKHGIHTPTVYFVDLKGKSIYLEFIEGKTVKEIMRGQPSQQEVDTVSLLIGKALSSMHNEAGLVHGDLTTSNMILHGDQLFLIDFGLAYVTTLAEDKAVDLYVLERAFLSTHPNSEEMFKKILEAYRQNSKKSGEAVLKKLEEVQMRGRKKLAFG
ncbi:TP53-regulating kinase-like [Planoprotostelium fungivorum]|uniref:non-specific serine/threonine protein kinase n=1 Tax=Planoprotostelium fungivorum TaxID=1890364 RepID=A0A2P6NCC7_9EUKA|nr:TP53-regulating kinase-like [Planoprotostelium fungivorum]